MDNFTKLQAEILNQGLKDNPLLRPHVIPILNNQLNGVQKDSVIKAINEVLSRVNIIDNSLNTFMGELLEIIGNWKNSPELKDNLDLMAGTLIESLIYLNNVVGADGLKRTVVFYVEKYRGTEKSIEIFVPYKGELSKLYLSIPKPSLNDIIGKLTVDENVFDITLPAGERFVVIGIEGTIDNSNCTFTIISGEEELEGINASLDFIQR